MHSTGNGLLKKKILKKGEGNDSRPQRQQEVSINYEAKLADGTTVEKEENFVFILGDQDVVDVRQIFLFCFIDHFVYENIVIIKCIFQPLPGNLFIYSLSNCQLNFVKIHQLTLS